MKALQCMGSILLYLCLYILAGIVHVHAITSIVYHGVFALEKICIILVQ